MKSIRQDVLVVMVIHGDGVSTTKMKGASRVYFLTTINFNFKKNVMKMLPITTTTYIFASVTNRISNTSAME